MPSGSVPEAVNSSVWQMAGGLDFHQYLAGAAACHVDRFEAKGLKAK